MIKEIQAKTILSHSKSPDPWFGIQYTMNLYRGCQHQCIYCDSRSECYQIENFNDTLVKVNALELLKKELPRKRIKGTVGTGSMNDPYAPVEKQYQLTRGALNLFIEYGFPVHVLTKSKLVMRDVDLLSQIARDSQALVSFTITTCDDNLGKKLEPGAALVSERLAAMKYLSERGIKVGVLLMPVLPFIEDNWENIRGIVELAHAHGAGYILAAFGMTQRKGSQEYYLRQLERLFPGMKEKHLRAFGNRYECAANGAQKLSDQFKELCSQKGITLRVPQYKVSKEVRQLSLLGI
jgi:DNA repair photolyase